ncbi:DUF881 domain-containing protein [Nocardioides sp. W7]|uniref:DUF881 domain-containing protein n=1 Tax=Nocardioides sp. W7 TaxID=2931390 RepID=UPI001FD28E0A|nr:DUF881 domain-containing protein [Nocardioides sp. W7]
MPETRERDQLPARVTMPLLTLITQQSLDEDYLHAAERRIAQGGVEPPARRSRRTAAVVVVAAVFGILVTIAAVQTNRNADTVDASRASLIERNRTQRESVARQQEQIAELREQNAKLDERLVATDAALQSAEAANERLQVRTGRVAVRGPGVRITVDDPDQGEERIRKEDLFLLINGLWESGAEAISLNGHRLGVLTSINNSDVAINVESSALLPPYTLEAIGNVGTLGADLLDTSSFATFDALQDRYGFGFDMDNDDAIVLAAARAKRLRNASLPTIAPDRRTNEGTTP